MGVAPVYHKEPRLSQEVLYRFATDDWDERVDAVGRGLMGLTIACARCHDHKFDPIKQTDYQGLAGVFASTMRAERPMRADMSILSGVPIFWVAQRLFDMNVIMGILSGGEKQTNPEWAAKKLEGMKLERRQLQAEIATLKVSLSRDGGARCQDRHHHSVASRIPAAEYQSPGCQKRMSQTQRLMPKRIPGGSATAAAKAPAAPQRRRGALASDEPFMNSGLRRRAVCGRQRSVHD